MAGVPKYLLQMDEINEGTVYGLTHILYEMEIM